ncbi:MAG TPA: DUF4476 domain-containing protein [Flavisolibacter sp.]|nr:DUF4476 domain-containing protein [Flavisolibacter sp.]
MKTILSLMIGTFLTISASAGTIRIVFNGNRDYQAVVDGRSYSSNDYTTGANNELVLNLQNGQHTVQIFRTNRRGISKQVYSSTFNLNYDQDIRLTIGANGSVTREEISNNSAYGSPDDTYRTPMSSANFQQLYDDIRGQWLTSSKLSAAREAFNNNYNYFTTVQTREILRLFSSERDRLELAKISYDNLVDPSSFTQLYDLFSTQASRDELDSYVRNNYNNYPNNNNPNNNYPNNYPNTYPNNNYPNTYPGNTYRSPMSSYDYDRIYKTISGRWSQSSKLSAARDAFNNSSYYFSTEQASRIIRLVNSEAGRLELAKLSYDNLVDPASFSDLYQLFGKQASRDELARFAANNNSNYNYNTNDPYNRNYGTTHTPMTEASFNTIYDNIRKQWLPGMKMSTARDAFNQSSNYFTTSQARQIIGLVSSESNRLELAKLSFDNITDQANFRQIYDLLNSQSSRDQLDEYIRSNYNYQY